MKPTSGMSGCQPDSASGLPSLPSQFAKLAAASCSRGRRPRPSKDAATRISGRGQRPRLQLRRIRPVADRMSAGPTAKMAVLPSCGFEPLKRLEFLRFAIMRYKLLLSWWFRTLDARAARPLRRQPLRFSVSLPLPRAKISVLVFVTQDAHN